MAPLMASRDAKMKLNLLKMQAFIIIFLALLFLFLIGCESTYRTITYINETPVPVKVAISRAPPGYLIPKRLWDYAGDIINPGESKTLLTNVSKGKITYMDVDWAATAVAPNGTMLLSKLYTWDELNSLNFTIVIELPK